MKILLVSAATPDTFWSFKHVLPFVAKKAAFPPLGLLTVAAMLPREWDLKLIDLNVTRLTDADLVWADYIFVSAMIVQADSARQVIARANSLGKPLVAGGPLFMTGHDQFPEVQHFVLGEAENIMPDLIADMVAGQVKHRYRHEQRPDLSLTPVPRWDLINMSQYALMPLQSSRGCPFNCEFCDIIVMNGRVPRVKSTEQMIRELDSLVDAGWNDSIFIVDDNFIGNKVKVKAFLRELIAWRERRDPAIAFTTEASLNLADDPELLDLMARAGFKKVFVGIETPEEASLTECAKVQNTQRDLIAAVRTIQKAGIEVMGGFIVGFDNDKPNIFERQIKFIQEAGIATAMVGLLTALPGTRLWNRLKEEGRIISQTTGNNLDAVLNFIPKLDREMLIEGYRSLVKRLYTPKAYYARILTFLREYHPRGPQIPRPASDIRAVIKSLWIMGVLTRGRREYWKFLTKILVFHRRAFPEAMTLAITGYHFRRIAAAL
ncbi:MAG TPA: DUF4070 domain-containing protein [Phycisphaerae bacterium]|nr:DUF4070 domain-containing protein [Phycisphaerae bacterium]HRY66924.1 DUF4070 domain-containing protein [Phycisphaerae bacterium]HSA27872.1 DUF4070 domain-containing protein [Phycisphaerae bacterium]